LLLCCCRSARLALAQLSGTWKLLYTNHTPTLLVLNALHSLPLADLGEVYQVVDAEQLTAYNQVGLRATGEEEIRT
jgi:hypothetical protein